VIQTFAVLLFFVTPHPVLGFLTGRCPVGFVGRNHYTWASFDALFWLFILRAFRPRTFLL